MIRVLSPRRFSPGRTVAACTVLLTLVVVLVGSLLADVADPAFQGLDDGWYSLMATSHSPFWDSVNGLLNLAGYQGILVLHVLLAAALLVRRRPQAAIFTAVAGAVVILLTQLLKAGILRAHPDTPVVLTDTGSYPSGHVATTAAFLLVLAILAGRAWVWALAVLGSITMMVSRTYLQAQWLMDTAGGLCLAAAVVPLLWLAYQNICIQENIDSGRLLTWKARASRRRRAAEQ
ncbi:phosphatase PAP2 family protein [Micrococcaceae bacterium Sec5.7]